MPAKGSRTKEPGLVFAIAALVWDRVSGALLSHGGLSRTAAAYLP
jgi:hypothetical protein